jgi:CRP-like cAMP-binding protein
LVSFHSIIESVAPLSAESQEALLLLATEVSFSRGHHLFEAGKTDRNVYFLIKGIARAYCYSEDTELTFWFGSEGNVVLSYNSYVYRKPGYEHIELLEDAILYQVPGDALETLYNQHIDMANWGRKLAEQELIKTEERFISRQFRTAAERYTELLQQTPELLQRVQLGHIASYLGVTQVTLSRIRAAIR